MFGENFLIFGTVTAIASLVAFALKKGPAKDLLEIFSSFAAFVLFYPFAIAWSPVYILIHYIRVTKKSGISGTMSEIVGWFSSYQTSANSKKPRANSKAHSNSISTVPEVAEEVSS